METPSEKDVHIHNVNLPRKIKYVKILRAEDQFDAEAAQFEAFDENAFDELTDLEEEESAQVSVEELEKAAQEAYQQGFEEGKAALQPMFEEALKEQNLMRESFESIFANLHREYRTSEQTMEATAVRLGMMIAETILRREVLQDSEIVITQVRKALHELYDAETVRINIHPSHYEALENIKSTLLSEQNTISGMEIVANDAVEIGGCILETDIGNVDATITTQLQKIGVQLDDAVHSKENISSSASQPTEAYQEETPIIDDINSSMEENLVATAEATTQEELIQDNFENIETPQAAVTDEIGDIDTLENTIVSPPTQEAAEQESSGFDDISPDELEALLGDDFDGLE